MTANANRCTCGGSSYAFVGGHYECLHCHQVRESCCEGSARDFAPCGLCGELDPCRTPEECDQPDPDRVCGSGSNGGDMRGRLDSDVVSVPEMRRRHEPAQPVPAVCET